MAVLACEIFTKEFCSASLFGGTLIGRLSDGKICFLPMGAETNAFRDSMRRCDRELTSRNNVFHIYGKRMVKDKYVKVHAQGHFIQLHNRPLEDKPSWQKRVKKASAQECLDF